MKKYKKDCSQNMKIEVQKQLSRIIRKSIVAGKDMFDFASKHYIKRANVFVEIITEAKQEQDKITGSNEKL